MPNISVICLKFKDVLWNLFWNSSQDADEEIKEVLAKYSTKPDSESRLKSLLPRIIATFGGNKPVKNIIEELKNHQLSADTLGMLVHSAFHS